MIFLPYVLVTLVVAGLVTWPLAMAIEYRRDRRRKQLKASERANDDLIRLVTELETAAQNLSETDPLISDLFVLPIRKFRKEHPWF